MINDVKKDLYIILNSLGYKICQSYPNTYETLPIITYELASNSLAIDLDRNIGYQDLNFKIDIWGNSSQETSNVFLEVESLLREHDYILEFQADIPNTDENIWHLSTRFKIKD